MKLINYHEIDYKKFHGGRRIWIALISLMSAILVLGCTGVSVPEGWSSATVADDIVYIGTMDGDFRALDLNSGEVQWIFSLRGQEKSRAVYGTPVVHEETIYFGGYDGILYALSIDGDELWDRQLGDGLPIVGGPALTQDLVIIGSSDGNLYALNINDGSSVWKFSTGNRIWSTPVIADGAVSYTHLTLPTILRV